MYWWRLPCLESSPKSPLLHNICIHKQATDRGHYLEINHIHIYSGIDSGCRYYTYVPSNGGMCQRGMVLPTDGLPVSCASRETRHKKSHFRFDIHVNLF